MNYKVHDRVQFGSELGDHLFLLSQKCLSKHKGFII